MEQIVKALVYFVGPDGVTTFVPSFTFEGTNADGEPSVGNGALLVESYPMVFNGTTFDRQRSAPDNADASAALGLGTPATVARLQGWNGSTYDRVRVEGNSIDADPLLTAGVLAAQGYQYALNGATWDRVRTPATFKGITSAAVGPTAVWTPAAGKRFRLMRYMIQFSPDATLAVAGAITATLSDAAVGLPFFLRSYFTAAIPGNPALDSSGWVDLGNGYVSTAANNALNLTLSVALASGVCSVFVAGTEE